jgi:hypothetical protein
MVGPAGFEPTVRESKSLALPLGYGPIYRMGRLKGVEPSNAGTTTRCVNRFATTAISIAQLLLYNIFHICKVKLCNFFDLFAYFKDIMYYILGKVWLR